MITTVFGLDSIAESFSRYKQCMLNTLDRYLLAGDNMVLADSVHKDAESCHRAIALDLA